LRRRCRVRHRLAFNGVADRAAVAAERNRADQRCRFNARDGAHVFDRALEEPRDVLGLRILVLRQAELQREHIRLVEPERRLLYGEQALNQQHRDRDQGDREPDLDDHQDVARPVADTRCPARAGLQDTIDVGTRRPQRRSQAAHRRRQQRDDAGEEQDARVERNVGRDRHRRRRLQPAQPGKRPSPEQKAADRRGGSQKRRLDGQLARDRAAAGAERHPQGDFALAVDRAGQQQLADVDARDEQHDADRREQQKERGPGGPDDGFLRGLGAECASRLRDKRRLRAGGGLQTRRDQPLADHFQIRGRARDVHARLEAPDAEHDRTRRMQSARHRKLRDRNEHVGAEEVPVAGHRVGIERRCNDANHRERHAVQCHRLADGGVASVEAALPRLVRDDDKRLDRAGRALFVAEEPAALRFQPQHVEERSRHERADETLRLVDAGQVHALRQPQRDRFERV
jgi:hypothetical protein